ncbi:MAG: cobalt ABC transporter permease [Desulfuromonas sp.]|nr:MAG: cobalt ABC transporter permease [Desulfuromonas sp.]
MKRFLLTLLFLATLASPLLAEEKTEKWTGIDEAVIERYATEQGREAAEPLFNVEGDMLLFLFAMAGAIGGFIMGYQWHKVFVAGKDESEKD